MATSAPAKTRDSDFCSVNFLTYFFHIFNIVFLLSGCGVLAVGLWSVLYKHQYVSLLTTVTYALTAYVLVIAGALVLFVVILGCCGVWRENRCLLLVYTFLLLLIFLLEVMAGLLAYVYQAQVGDELAVTLNATFLETYRIKNEQTAAIDKMQQELTCCGVKSFEDWQYSVWKQQSGESPIRVPDTCCLTPSPGCGRSISPSNIYYAGCKDGFTYALVEQLNIIGAVGLGICVIQVFGMILSCCLYLKLRYVTDFE
ncbi:LOW QUALITY PROTEIN: CD151 antigen-like [Homalodisca vitripennis]|uniref:Tetraspanin n=1 Tax=Homalodisca liturata TaxID=320908 RepID=A0A1B6JEN1_9HEMI|nr:LOW QUALITY PROTEIN: CD151 antigen-like [Homalodisca vitripennis]